MVRELTKIHETVFTTTLSEAINYYEENAPRGEFVLIVKGKTEEETEKYSLEDAINIAIGLMDKGESASSAAKEAASLTGFKKGDIYKGILEQG